MLHTHPTCLLQALGSWTRLFYPICRLVRVLPLAFDMYWLTLDFCRR